MSLFKSAPSSREQMELISNDNQIELFEQQILHHEIISSADALFFQFWLQNQNVNPEEYHFALSHLEWFLIKTNNGQMAYGGNQYWWKHKHFFNAGCGTVTASNIVYYIARYTEQPALLQNPALYDTTNQPTQENDFMKFMEYMVQYVTPNCNGISTVSFFENGFKKYVDSLGYSEPTWFVHSASHKTTESIFKAAQFIRTHLEANRPIGCLHWFHVGHMQVFNPMEAQEEFTDMNWHWVTITELYQKEDTWRIVVSSCGLRYELDFFHFLHGEPALVTMELTP